MKSLASVVALAAITVSGCHAEEPMQMSDIAKVRFSFSDKEIVVSLTDNSATRSFVDMLPLTLEFEDYAGEEKISHPPKKLDTSDVPAGYDPSVGDLTLYAPWGNLAFFYRDHGYARGLVPMGKIVSGASFLKEMDKAGDVHVELAQ